MSAEMVSSTNAVEVYVRLLNEGTDVLRPTTGLLLAPDVVQISAIADYDPTIEEWEFPPGCKVRCASEIRGGNRMLVARERVE